MKKEMKEEKKEEVKEEMKEEEGKQPKKRKVESAHDVYPRCHKKSAPGLLKEEREEEDEEEEISEEDRAKFITAVIKALEEKRMMTVARRRRRSLSSSMGSTGRGLVAARQGPGKGFVAQGLADALLKWRKLAHYDKVDDILNLEEFDWMVRDYLKGNESGQKECDNERD